MADYNNPQVRMAFSELGEKMRGMMVWFWLTFFLSILIFPPIVFIIKYFGFLSKLKKCSELTGDPNLEKAYKMELYALILTIIMPIIILASFFGAIYSMDFGSMFTVILLFSVLVLTLPFIFRLISVIALENWALSFGNQAYSFSVAEIIKGAKRIKTGTILSIIPFINIIGVIIYYSGFSKMGTNLMLTFGTPTSQVGQPTINIVNTTASYSSSAPPPVANQTIPPRSQKLCPYCNTPVPIDAKFCAKCGNPL